MKDARSAATPRQARLRRYASARRGLLARTSRVAFERLVREALDSLPESIRERMENIAVVVEEGPRREKLVALGYDPDQDLLGLYEGVPRPQRGTSYHLAVPDRITIFRQPILDEVGPGGDAAVVQEVRKTVIHEVAHHFGIGDAELERLERQAWHRARVR